MKLMKQECEEGTSFYARDSVCFSSDEVKIPSSCS